MLWSGCTASGTLQYYSIVFADCILCTRVPGVDGPYIPSLLVILSWQLLTSATFDASRLLYMCILLLWRSYTCFYLYAPKIKQITESYKLATNTRSSIIMLCWIVVAKGWSNKPTAQTFICLFILFESKRAKRPLTLQVTYIQLNKPTQSIQYNTKLSLRMALKITSTWR